MTPRTRSHALVVILLTGLAAAGGCGKKGPPLAPLRLVPSAPTDLSARRGTADVRLRVVLPTTNQGGEGRLELDRVQVYAMTVAANTPPPPNRELLTERFVVGTIAVKPVPLEGAPVPDAADTDTRPGAGEPATFTELMTPETLTPVVRPAAAAGSVATPPGFPAPVPVALPPAPAPAPVAPGVAVPGAGAPTVAPGATDPAGGVPVVAPPVPPPIGVPYPVRVYVVRGLTRSGRPGPPSARVQVPLIDVPARPTGVAATSTETAVVVQWASPVQKEGEIPVVFNVYKAGDDTPLNAVPIAAAPLERGGVAFGVEQCFTVRSVVVSAGVTLESDQSAPAACVTPRDTYPPAAPKRPAAVADAGVVNLIWDANADTDLGGYLILRAEAPGGTLQPLTQDPVRETTYTDKTVTPGVRYAYALVAVDRATPANRSAQSPAIEVTAR